MSAMHEDCIIIIIIILYVWFYFIEGERIIMFWRFGKVYTNPNYLFSLAEKNISFEAKVFPKKLFSIEDHAVIILV